MRQRRRAERGYSQHRVGQSHTRRLTERTQQRLLIWGTLAVVLFLVFLLGGGWVFTSYLPARDTVAVVDGQRVQARDLIVYTKLEGTVTGLLQPERALNNYVRDMIFRSRAVALGVSVSSAEIDREIAAWFTPGANDEDPPDEITPEVRQRLDELLAFLDIRERDFRGWIEGQLLETAIGEHFVSEVPELAEQVFLHWIITANADLAQEAYDRIQAGEDFAEVARELNEEAFLADENGEVGWVPGGYLTGIEDHLFGEDAVYGEAVGPLTTPYGPMVLMVSQERSEQPVSEEVRERLGFGNFQQWLDSQSTELISEMGLSSANIRWINNRIL